MTGRPSPLAHAVRRTIHDNQLLSPGNRVLAAVSGGVDSMVLLAILHELAGPLGLTLHAAHLNHDLRGDDARRDAELVADFCAKKAIPHHADTQRPDPKPGESPQAAARRVRYAFLHRVATQIDAHAIATAHHADDLAESLVMRLITGAGTAGLAGMAMGRRDRDRRLIRPLLPQRKQTLIDHAAKRAIPYRQDASNHSPRYLRNRIRQQLMPVLAQFNPNIVATLTRQAERLAEEEVHLADQARRAAERWVTIDHVTDHGDTAAGSAADQRVRLAADGILALPAALGRRVVYHALQTALPIPPETRHVDGVFALLSGPAGRSMDLPGTVRAVAEYGTVVIGPPPAPVAASAIPVAVPGITPIPWGPPGYGAIETRPGPVPAVSPLGTPPHPADAEPGPNHHWVALDRDRLPGPLVVRPRQPGDRFFPMGMGGRSQKLKDFLITRKVPREQRDQLPLLCAGEAILAVAGLRLDGRFPANPDTDRRLWVRWRTGPEGG